MSQAAIKQPRVLTFDLMRGYFLVAIIIDHLRFFPNGLDWLSMQGGLFVTAAEGFFLISGIVLGIVRGPKLLDRSFKHVSKLLLRRGVQLYVTTVVLVLIFTLIGWFFYMNNPGLKPGIISPNTSIGVLLFKVFTFQYFYGWADYLRLYAIFLLVSPLLMWLLRQGKWYIVLLLSLGVWALFPDQPGLSFEVREEAQTLSWQLLFFGGMIIGFHWPQLTSWWSGLSQRLQRSILIPLLTTAVVTLVYSVLIMMSTKGYDLHAIGATPELQHYLFDNFFNKERMPLTRVALFLVWFWASFYIFHRFEAPIKRWFGWILQSFGTNSLYVYTLHAFAIFFIDLYLVSGNIAYNFIVTISVLLVIRIMIHYQVLMKVIPR